MPKPSPATYPIYFQKYIDQVDENDLASGFKNQSAIIGDFLNTISAEKSTYAYAEGKWTIKEVLQHITDTERIFNFRALCFARNDKTSFPGFDENEYASHSNANNRTWGNLVKEFLTVRAGTEMLFESFSPTVLETMGIANNNPTSVVSMGFITLGHLNHHKKILVERYL